ncbi:hypothetical protein [Nocardia brevicatena]|uniref:hypothetical protein n=1 Tax=Nocardia brevicatena TaxID=37327 RepID=UPI0002F9A6CE
MWLRRGMDESSSYRAEAATTATAEERGAPRILLRYPRECLVVRRPGRCRTVSAAESC